MRQDKKIISKRLFKNDAMLKYDDGSGKTKLIPVGVATLIIFQSKLHIKYDPAICQLFLENVSTDTLSLDGSFAIPAQSKHYFSDDASFDNSSFDKGQNVNKEGDISLSDEMAIDLDNFKLTFQLRNECLSGNVNDLLIEYTSLRIEK